MQIKGYVVPLRARGFGSKTSKSASKGLDNSSFETDLYMLGRSLTLGTVVNTIFCITTMPILLAPSSGHVSSKC